MSTELVRKYKGGVGGLSALIEAAVNVGYLAGPVLGGALYTW